MEEYLSRLKKYLKKEDLYNLCAENLLNKLERWMKPVEDKSRAFRLSYFPNVAYNKVCKERQYYNWYWLDNACSGDSRNACYVYGDGGGVDGNSVGSSNLVRPTFFNVNQEILNLF